MNKDDPIQGGKDGDQAAEQEWADLLALVGRVDASRKNLIAEVESRLNDYLGKLSPGTAESKERVTALVKGVLERVGLAIDFDGQPCSFYSTSGKKDRNGRFRLTPRGSSQHVKSSSLLQDFLPFKIVDPLRDVFPVVDSTTVANASGLWRDRVAKDGATKAR